MKNHRNSLRQGLLLSFVVVVAVAGLFVAREVVLKTNYPEAATTETFHGFPVDPPQPVPQFELVDQRREPFRIADHEGNVIVMFFGYTNCPDVCPATLVHYSQVKRELGPLADRVSFVFVTVDPEYDTPERLGRFVSRFDPSFYGLSRTPQETAEATKAFGVYVDKFEDENSPVGYWVNHGTLSYVIDTAGRLVLVHPFDTDPKLVADDLRKLL